MPPLPKTSGAGKEGRADRPKAREAKTEGNSSARKTSRVTMSMKKEESLKTKIESLYMVVGTMLRPLGRYYPVLSPIADNLKTFSSDAAEAWIELANEDPRVKQFWVSVTAASVYGNVIGVHLTIFAQALPMFSGDQPRDEQGRFTSNDDMVPGWMENMSPEDIMQAQAMARRFMEQQNEMPVTDMDTGGPGDTIRVQADPTPSGIVSPEQLGVTNYTDGEPRTFPNDANPANGR